MAIARLQEWEPQDSGTSNYDAVTEKVAPEGGAPDGLLFHTAGFTDDGLFRIFEVWESSEHAERFDEERLMPAIDEVSGGDANPPERQETYELHNVLSGS